MSAGCNGCDIQIYESLDPKYKLRELEVEIVTEPEEANVLAVTGGVNFKGKEELSKAYAQLKPPKLVLAVGNCATSKGIFDKGYPMAGPPNQIIPVHLYINGCPPRPQAIVAAIAQILGADLDTKEDYWNAPEGFRGKHEFDVHKCVGCGACAQVCSSNAISILEKDGKRSIAVDYGICTFCGFCQDQCPTQAIRLTQRYSLINSQRDAMNVKNEVELARCCSCGAYFLPEEQIKWALARVTEKVQRSKEYSRDLGQAVRICYQCRKQIANIRRAKKVLYSISSHADRSIDVETLGWKE